MLSTGKKSESRQPIVKTAPSIPTVAASSSSSNAPPLLLSPPWTELPDDLTANILQRLDAQERLESAQLVCSTWWRACKNPAMWRVIDFSIPRCQYSEFQNVLRCAIDRSQGQLVELKITGTAYDWPHYISERSSQLRCLTLVDFYTDDLCFAIEKLPRLEELHLYMSNTLFPGDFETFGISCPMLKSFTYSNNSTEHGEISDHAVAIGKTMPNLCYLRLNGHRIENYGLEAILDGCSKLELLDLGECSGLDLRGDLSERCFEQINDLRLPSIQKMIHCDWDYDSESSDAWNPNYDPYFGFYHDNYSNGDSDYDSDFEYNWANSNRNVDYSWLNTNRRW